MLNIHAVRFDLWVQVAPFHDEKVLKRCSLGMAGYNSGDASVIVSYPLVEAILNVGTAAGVGGNAGWVFCTETIENLIHLFPFVIADG